MKEITWQDLIMVSILNSILCKLGAGHDCIICILQLHVVWCEYIAYYNMAYFMFSTYTCLVLL